MLTPRAGYEGVIRYWALASRFDRRDVWQSGRLGGAEVLVVAVAIVVGFGGDDPHHVGIVL